LARADLASANLSGADLTGADLRHAVLRGALLAGTCLSGAKVAGIVGTGREIEGVVVSWLDTSGAGDGSRRLDNGEIRSLLSGIAADPGERAARRYFGCGDVLRNATLQFDAGARVEIDSLFENCTINLGEGTEVVVGAAGVLADCQILGAGNITVHGKFFERQSPGIVGPRRLVVSSRGALVSSVAQSDELTQFAFERGCQLRVKIIKSSTMETKPSDGARS
jgi:hypothetical protein